MNTYNLHPTIRDATHKTKTAEITIDNIFANIAPCIYRANGINLGFSLHLAQELNVSNYFKYTETCIKYKK